MLRKTLITMACSIAAVLTIVAATLPANAETHTAQSYRQLELRPGDSARSPDGQYTLVHQGDGNVVLYGPAYGAIRPIWHTGTHGRDTNLFVFQGDGNLVLYGEGRALWHTATHGSGNALAVQNDGNVVIYSATKAVWASRGIAPPRPPAPTGGVEGAITAYFGGPNTRLGAQARRVVQCESQGNPNARSRTNDHGIFQINYVHRSAFPKVTGSPFFNGVYNPYENAQYAKDLYNRQGWGPWTCKP